MRFALVTADTSHRVSFKINPETGDATSFMQWVDILRGVHLSYAAITEEDEALLKSCDLVMMSGHPSHVVDIIRIARMLKDTQAVSMFYPEGSTQLYDNSVRGFHKEYYEAWNACDVLSAAEEDKLGYYRSFVTKDTLVRFIHVPTTRDMEAGGFLVPRRSKTNAVLVYGDNNPNHPLIAMACAKKIGAHTVLAVEIGKEIVESVGWFMEGTRFVLSGKMSQNQFLRNLGETLVHFYPTDWIGTARQAISCAAVGTPCVGNHDSHTQRRLFPELGCDVYDIERMAELGLRLLSDEEFYNGIVRRAFDRSSFYGLESTKRRLFEAWQEASRLKNERAAALACQ